MVIGLPDRTMSQHVCTIIPLPSLPLAYIELELYDGKSVSVPIERNFDLVGFDLCTIGDSDKTVLGWGISRYGRLLTLYSIILQSDQRAASTESQVLEENGDLEKGVNLLEYRLPSAALGAPLIFSQSDNFVRIAVLCKGLVLTIFDVVINRRALLVASSRSVTHYYLRKELELLFLDPDSLESDHLSFCPHDISNGFFSKSDGTILRLSCSEKLIEEPEMSEIKLMKLTKSLPYWQIRSDVMKGGADKSESDFNTMKFLGMCLFTVGRDQFLVCASQKILIVFETKKRQVRCVNVLSRASSGKLDLGEVTLVDTAGSIVKSYRKHSETFICVHAVSSRRNEGMMILSIMDEQLLHSRKKDTSDQMEFVNFIEFPNIYSTNETRKLLDFECMLSHKRSHSALYRMYCLIEINNARLLIMSEFGSKISDSTSWEDIDLGNFHMESLCSRFKDNCSDELLGEVFSGSVYYPIVREAVLRFIEQGNIELSFIDFAYNFEKLKSVTYYAIVNAARKVIFDLYGEKYSHTFGYEELHKTIINSITYEFLKICDTLIARYNSPLLVKYHQDSSSVMLFGLNSFGVIRDRTYYERFELSTPLSQSDVTYKHEHCDYIKTLTMLVRSIPQNVQTISIVVESLLYKEYSGDIQVLFENIADCVFKDVYNPHMQDFLSIYTSIADRDTFFSSFFFNEDLELDGNDDHTTQVSTDSKIKASLAHAQLAIQAYVQISSSTYETTLEIILVILYAYFINNESTEDLKLDINTLRNAILRINIAALHKILSNDNDAIDASKLSMDNNVTSTTLFDSGKKCHFYPDPPRVEPDIDPHKYYDNLNINTPFLEPTIYINNPKTFRTSLLCLFNSYKCLDFFSCSKLNTNIVYIALKFISSLKSPFSTTCGLLSSTKDLIILLVELIKLGNHKTVREIINICPRNSLIYYIQGRYASVDGHFDLAKSCFEHFSSYLVNINVENSSYPIELLAGVLPDHIIESRNLYRYYMHIINDCSTSKNNEVNHSFVIHFSNLGLLVSKDIKEKKTAECVSSTILQRMFDSYLEVGDISGCTNIMAEFIQTSSIGHLIQRILRYCTLNKKLSELIYIYPMSPYADVLISEIYKVIKATSLIDQPDVCFEYVCCLFSLHIKERDRKKACSTMYGFSQSLMKSIQDSVNDFSKSYKHLEILCQSYIPVIYILKQLPDRDAWFLLLSDDLDYKQSSKSNATKQVPQDISPKLCFLKEMEIEYGRIFALQNSIYHYGDAFINNKIPSKEEALELYIECRDYERAFDYALKCNLGLEGIFVSLTEMCLSCQAEDPSSLPTFLINSPNYLSVGDTDIIQHQVVAPSEKLWMILKKRLDEVDGASGNYKNYIVVASHFLKSQKTSDLPFWIKNTLKKNCIDKLLQLFLDHHDAPTAASILSKEMKRRKDTVVKEGFLNNTKNISPHLIDHVLIQAKTTLLKSVSHFKEFRAIVSSADFHEYDFSTYPNTLIDIKNTHNFSTLPEFAQSLLKCALNLHENIRQYLKAVNAINRTVKTSSL